VLLGVQRLADAAALAPTARLGLLAIWPTGSRSKTFYLLRGFCLLGFCTGVAPRRTSRASRPARRRWSPCRAAQDRAAWAPSRAASKNRLIPPWAEVRSTAYPCPPSKPRFACRHHMVFELDDELNQTLVTNGLIYRLNPTTRRARDSLLRSITEQRHPVEVHLVARQPHSTRKHQVHPADLRLTGHVASALSSSRQHAKSQGNCTSRAAVCVPLVCQLSQTGPNSPNLCEGPNSSESNVLSTLTTPGELSQTQPKSIWKGS
jgi:hypothetical protein